LYSRMLHHYDESIEIATASSGMEALQQLAADPLPGALPDVILLDVVMSNMDGWQFLDHKRQDATIKEIPVIVISAEDLVAQVIKSDLLLATAGQGITVNQLLRASLYFSRIILDPVREVDLVSE
jgi:CheY-like chemotaxis protein